MSYIKVRWLHSLEGEPYEILLELDRERYELRKIEKFKNGEIGFCSGSIDCNSSGLSELPVPSLDEINCDKQFIAESMSIEAFEDEWGRALHAGSERDN